MQNETKTELSPRNIAVLASVVPELAETLTATVCDPCGDFHEGADYIYSLTCPEDVGRIWDEDGRSAGWDIDADRAWTDGQVNPCN